MSQGFAAGLSAKLLVMLLVLLSLVFVSTAMADWPSGSQGDQYAAVNSAMESAASIAGISPGTFINIYNDAVAGNLYGYSDTQLIAACEVMQAISSYSDILADYDMVQASLGCGCQSEQPNLSLSRTGVYWNSFADYIERSLTVGYSIHNVGIGAYDVNVTIVGSVNTGGVTVISNLPVYLNNIPGGGSMPYVLKYYVPESITSFYATTYVTTTDLCGNKYFFPGPYPGS